MGKNEIIVNDRSTNYIFLIIKIISSCSGVIRTGSPFVTLIRSVVSK